MNLFVSLRYLVSLDDHRHFGRAALACHVTQPALSNAIRALEAGFGTAIVKRGRAFAGFTPEGERILASARRMLREHELLQQDLHSLEAAPQGQLVIGAVPTAMPVAARFAARLQAQHPGIVPQLRSLSSVELETGLEGLAIDLGLGYTERLGPGRAALRCLPAYGERYYLLRRAAAPASATAAGAAAAGPAAAPGSEAAGPSALGPTAESALVPAAGAGLQWGPPLRWRDAAQLPLCLLGAEMHNRTVVDRAFAAAGVRPKPALETNSILALALCAASGTLCSVMPGALVDVVQSYSGLEAMPLVEPEPVVPIAFIVHPTQQPSRTLQAALALVAEPAWQQEVARHAGLMQGLVRR